MIASEIIISTRRKLYCIWLHWRKKIRIVVLLERYCSICATCVHSLFYNGIRPLCDLAFIFYQSQAAWRTVLQQILILVNTLTKLSRRNCCLYFGLNFFLFLLKYTILLCILWKSTFNRKINFTMIDQWLTKSIKSNKNIFIICFPLCYLC